MSSGYEIGVFRPLLVQFHSQSINPSIWLDTLALNYLCTISLQFVTVIGRCLLYSVSVVPFPRGLSRHLVGAFRLLFVQHYFLRICPGIWLVPLLLVISMYPAHSILHCNGILLVSPVGMMIVLLALHPTRRVDIFHQLMLSIVASISQ